MQLLCQREEQTELVGAGIPVAAQELEAVVLRRRLVSIRNAFYRTKVIDQAARVMKELWSPQTGWVKDGSRVRQDSRLGIWGASTCVVWARVVGTTSVAGWGGGGAGRGGWSVGRWWLWAVWWPG